MTERTESPWKRLAERLGVGISENAIDLQDQPEHMWALLDTNDAQDLLIGRALRVAEPECGWWWSQHGELVREIAEARGDSRAVAALELLEAVGYEP